MSIKSTIRGGLAGIKRTLSFTQGEGGPHIDPLMPAPTPPASQDEASPYGRVRPTPEDGQERPKSIPKSFEIPDSKPQKNFQERADEANPYGIPRPMSKPPKSKPVKKSTTEYPKDTSKIGSAPKPMEQYPSKPYIEPDPADPQGIKRPDFKPNKTMSQYDGKGK